MNYFKKVLLSASAFLVLFSLFCGMAYAEGTRTGTTTGDSVNLRESPSTSSKVLTVLAKGTQVTVIDSSDGWYKVSSGSLTGWMSSAFVTIKSASETPKEAATFGNAKITADDVNLRKGPSTSSEVITKLDSGAKVNVLGRSGEWYNIKTSGGTTGWVYKDFVLVRESSSSRGGDESAAPSTEKADPSADQSIVEYAKKFLGVRYVYGGSSPSGFDCSGFVLYVFSHFGISLQRVAADQAKQGTFIKRSDLRPGDAIFFDTDGGHNYICHVGIYIGNGNFIHASSGRSTHRVVISSLSDTFYSNAYMTGPAMAESVPPRQ